MIALQWRNLSLVRDEIYESVERVCDDKMVLEWAFEITKTFYEDSRNDFSYATTDVDIQKTAARALAHYTQNYINQWPTIERKGFTWRDRILFPWRISRVKTALWSLLELAELLAKSEMLTGVA